MVLERVQVWIDPVERDGPAAMAVDEWLLETVGSPVLRVYRWSGAWGSVGYFGDLQLARAALPGLQWVRRWTGGGTVDHRADWTYSLMVPTGESIVRVRGAESYRLVHEALARVLRDEGIEIRLAAAMPGAGGPLCFEHPVGHDLVAPGGAKLAGAGQRRGRQGLLHQGSVALACDPVAGALRGERLAAELAPAWRRVECEPPQESIAAKVEARYGSGKWTEGRKG